MKGFLIRNKYIFAQYGIIMEVRCVEEVNIVVRMGSQKKSRFIFDRIFRTIGRQQIIKRWRITAGSQLSAYE